MAYCNAVAQGPLVILRRPCPRLSESLNIHVENGKDHQNAVDCIKDDVGTTLREIVSYKN